MAAHSLRKALAAVVAVLLVTAAAAPAHAADTLQRQTLMLVRTTEGPSSFDFSAVVEPGDGVTAFAGSVGARIEDGTVRDVLPGAQSSYGRTDQPTVYGAEEQPTTTCRLGGPCSVGWTILGSHQTWWSDEGGTDVPNRVFVVLEGARISYGLKAEGWEVQPVPFAYRYVDGFESDAIGFQHTFRGAELLFEATARGSAGGSIAQAVPPCSTSGSSVVSRGAGRMTLDGGVSPSTFTCPADRQTLVDHAPGATTWRAHGVVAGQTDLAYTHLFVVDPPASEIPPPADAAETSPDEDDTGAATVSGPSTVASGGGQPAPAAAAAAAPSAPAQRAAPPLPCTRTVTARRSRRAVTVRTVAGAPCRLRLRLLMGRRVISRATARVRPGRATTTRLRFGRPARPTRLVIEATDAAGDRTTRTLALR